MSIITTLDQQYIANTYNRFPIEIISGKGSLLFDSDNKEYIDLTSGIAVNTFGIADDDWIQTITKQASMLQHACNLFFTQPCANLGKLLCSKTNMSKVFFSNSGAEANECAIKIARKYSAETKGANYNTILSLEGSFHGRTLTTLAATGQDTFHKLFTPLTPGFVSAPINNTQMFIKTADENKLAGVIIECIQGEGGINVLDTDFVEAIAIYCNKNDIPLIIDEVQTGNGRSGKLYSYMNFKVNPDIISTAKGLAGGLPIGATMMNKKMSDVLGPGDHGSTFGGNPICCAAAINILNRIDDALLKDVRAKSKQTITALKDEEGVEDICGMGLMLGIKTTKPVLDVVDTCIKNGVLILTAKDKLRLLPALNIPNELLNKAIEVIKDAVK